MKQGKIKFTYFHVGAHVVDREWINEEKKRKKMVNIDCVLIHG